MDHVQCVHVEHVAHAEHAEQADLVELVPPADPVDRAHLGSLLAAALATAPAVERAAVHMATLQTEVLDHVRPQAGLHVGKQNSCPSLTVLAPEERELLSR